MDFFVILVGGATAIAVFVYLGERRIVMGTVSFVLGLALTATMFKALFYVLPQHVERVVLCDANKIILDDQHAWAVWNLKKYQVIKETTSWTMCFCTLTSYKFYDGMAEQASPVIFINEEN